MDLLYIAIQIGLCVVILWAFYLYLENGREFATCEKCTLRHVTPGYLFDYYDYLKYKLTYSTEKNKILREMNTTNLPILTRS